MEEGKGGEKNKPLLYLSSVGISLIEDTDLTTGRCCQNIVGIHSSQLMPASIPSGLALNADNFVNPF